MFYSPFAPLSSNPSVPGKALKADRWMSTVLIEAVAVVDK